MTTGALIFAYNNESFDYVRMAAWSAANIRRHLDIPVAVVTDHPTDLPFDQVILQDSIARDTRWFGDIDRRVLWNNHGRPDAFDLTPWDRTLLIDADYVVASDRLACLLSHDKAGFLCHRWASDITNQNDFFSLNHFGRYNMPLYWATVVIFNRDRSSQHVFDCMKMIREHWIHYKQIYHDKSKTYRNDHALSIALNMINGHQSHIDHIPWSLSSVLPDMRLQQLDQDCYRVDYVKSDNRPAWIEVANHDFHAMNKQSLGKIIA